MSRHPPGGGGPTSQGEAGQHGGELLRILGVTFGIAAGVGGTIGAGILRTPGIVAGHLQAPMLILLVRAVGRLGDQLWRAGVPRGDLRGVPAAAPGRVGGPLRALVAGAALVTATSLVVGSLVANPGSAVRGAALVALAYPAYLLLRRRAVVQAASGRPGQSLLEGDRP